MRACVCVCVCVCVCGGELVQGAVGKCRTWTWVPEPQNGAPEGGEAVVGGGIGRSV